MKRWSLILVLLPIWLASQWWFVERSHKTELKLELMTERMVAAEQRTTLALARFTSNQLTNAKILGGIDVKLDELGKDAWTKNQMFTTLNVQMGLELSEAKLVGQQAQAFNLEFSRRLGDYQKQLHELGTAVLGHVNARHGG